MLLLPPLYRWGNKGAKILSNDEAHTAIMSQGSNLDILAPESNILLSLLCCFYHSDPIGTERETTTRNSEPTPASESSMAYSHNGTF